MKFDNKNKPKGLKRIILASQNSLRAISWLITNESAFRQELALLLLLTPVSFILNVSRLEHMILILSLLFVIFTEVLNTAIEVVVDRIGLELHPLSGLAKDLGSAAVLVSLLIAAVVWGVVVFPLLS